MAERLPERGERVTEEVTYLQFDGAVQRMWGMEIAAMAFEKELPPLFGQIYHWGIDFQSRLVGEPIMGEDGQMIDTDDDDEERVCYLGRPENEPAVVAVLPVTFDLQEITPTIYITPGLDTSDREKFPDEFEGVPIKYVCVTDYFENQPHSD